MGAIDKGMFFLSIIIIVLALVLPTYVAFEKGHQWKEPAGKEPTWKFSDWAGAMTPLGTLLGLFIPIIQRDPLITGCSLLFGTTTLLIPFINSSIWGNGRCPNWFFLLWSTIMQLVVLAQLLLTANLADDSIVISIPALPLHIFRGCLIVGACFSLLYTWRTTREIIGRQTVSAKQQTSTASLPSGSTSPLQA